ncbi:MAG: hypothetical protein LBC06_00910 [Rickettsiales bacterium]|jgi:preprotein translocase subunit SecA|nr:hypothetical protein [Rickettsiales bacterium]
MVKKNSWSSDFINLPKDFVVETAAGGGDCFFDSMAKVLRQIMPNMDFTVKSLRQMCKQVAINNQQIKDKVIRDAKNIQDPTVHAPNFDVSDDEIWNTYLDKIEYTREDVNQIRGNNPSLYNSLTDIKYGTTLQVPIWGRPDIEGQMICAKYNIKLHLIEKYDIGWLHQIIDSSGSRSVEDVDYSEENIVHIANEGRAHFQPVIKQKIDNSRDFSSSNPEINPESEDDQKIGSEDSDSQASDTEKDDLADNKDYSELAKARKKRNETLKRMFDKRFGEKDYHKILYEDKMRIIEGIAGYFKLSQEKEKITSNLETLFNNTDDSTFPIVYETFFKVFERFSKTKGSVLHCEELCYLMDSFMDSIIEKREEKLKLWFIVSAYKQIEWTRELLLMQIENYLLKDLKQDGTEDRWRSYLSEIKNVNILILLKNKLDEYDESKERISAEQIENTLHLLSISEIEYRKKENKSKAEELNSEIEKLKLSEWYRILKEKYWLHKLHQLTSSRQTDDELKNNANLILELEKIKDTSLLERFVKILGEQESKLLPKDLTKVLSNFLTTTRDLDDELLDTLDELNDVKQWIDFLERSTVHEELNINQLVKLVETNPNTSKGISQKLSIIKESINSIHDSGYYSTILANSINCKKTISSFTEDDIKTWVYEFKKHRKCNAGSEKQYITETCKEVLAVVDQAIKLKRDFRLRDTQKLAVLAMVTNERNTLAQVSTGEGKSLIIVTSAIMQVLYGKKVDIVTSSSVLAKRDAESEPPAGNSDIYELFGVSVSHNCSENVQVRKRAYSADIVYGDLSNFQRDYLLYHFYEENVLGDRNFENVIVDEVDSMLLDGSNKMLYLSHSLADLDKLESVYLYIWKKVNLPLSEEGFISLKIKEDVLDELYSIVKKEDLKKLDSELSVEQVDQLWKSLIEANVLDAQGKVLKQSVNSDFQFSDRINYLLKERVEREKQIHVPNYLKPFVEENLETWINSAKKARFAIQEGYDYVVDIDRSGTSSNLDPQIIIIDRGTGTDFKSAKWRGGLHQFLELKHGCKLSSQSLKAVFISNVSFLKEYKKLYGLTGTLGSQVERQSLEEIHNVDFITVPTARPKQFQEKVSIVCKSKEDWIKKIYNETIQLTGGNPEAEKRSVLIICDTIDDVDTLIKAFQSKGTSNVHKYKRDWEEFDITQGNRKLNPGEIIIATNLAGRGSDIKLTDELKNAGGLHVCLTYLPDSLRVEEQAFGRAARSGSPSPSSGQMITMNPYGIEYGVMDLKSKRNAREVVHILNIHNHYTNKIQKEEECFKMFSKQYQRLNKELVDNAVPTKVREILLGSCLDKWAFWLNRNNKEDKENKNIEENLREWCEEFISELKDLDPKSWSTWVHDPVQIIKLAKYLAENRKYDNAINLFNKVINEEPFFSEAAHYYKAFTLAKKIDWSSKPLKGSDKEAFKELKAELQEAEKLFDRRSEFCVSAAAAVGSIKQKTNKERITQNNSYEDQKKSLCKLYDMFSQSVDDALGSPITSQSLINFDIKKELAEALYKELLEEGILKRPKVKKNISIKELKNISVRGLPIKVLVSFLSDFQGRRINEEEFQKKLKKNVSLPSKEAFWKHLIREKVLYEEIKYIVINKAKLEVIDYPLLNEINERVGSNELQEQILEFQATERIFFDLTQVGNNSSIFKKDKFIEVTGREKYVELKRRGMISSNKEAKIDISKIGSIVFPEYDSVVLKDFIDNGNLSEDEARKVLEDLVNKEILRLASDNKYELVSQNIKDIKFPIYNKAVTELLSSCFLYRLAAKDVENKLRSGNYPIHIQLEAKPHIDLMWKLAEGRIIKPVRVNTGIDDLEKDVKNIYNKVVGDQQDEQIKKVAINSIVRTLKQLQSPFKTLQSPESSLESIIGKPITKLVNIEEIRTVFVNGLDKLIRFKEEKWTLKMIRDTLTAAVFGMAQIAVGSAMAIYSSGILNNVASRVISVGISDIIFSIRAGFSGYFSWQSYKEHKIFSICIATALTSMKILGSIGSKALGLQVGETISIAESSIQGGERIISDIVSSTKAGIMIGLYDKAAEFSTETLLAASRKNISTAVSARITEESRNHGVFQSLRTSYSRLGKEETKKMIDLITNDYRLSYAMKEEKPLAIIQSMVPSLLNMILSEKPTVKNFLNNMKRQIDARLRSNNVDGVIDFNEEEYQSFQQDVINQWKQSLCEKIEQFISNHLSPILSEGYAEAILKAKEISQSEEVNKQSSMDPDAQYKKEVSSRSDNTIEIRIGDSLVERLNRHRNELLKQNPKPRTFIGEPVVSQANNLNKPR